MKDTLNKLKSSKPKCLNAFELRDASATFTSKWNSGDSFITKRITCKCGESELLLLVTPKIEIKGLFIKKEVITYLAPLYVKCPNCSTQKLLFNPSIHGWDGEAGVSSALLGDGELQNYNQNSGTIIVNYSYQGIENYDDLIEDGKANPEDYFDTFSVYFLSKENNLEEVVSYECG